MFFTLRKKNKKVKNTVGVGYKTSLISTFAKLPEKILCCAI